MKKITSITLIMLLACTTILNFTNTTIVSAASSENTGALCTDDKDNDENGLIDAADPACDSVVQALYLIANPPAPTITVSGATVPAAENTIALCTDDKDNDENGLIDAADPACDAAVQTIASTSTSTTIPGAVSGGGSSSFSGGGFGGSSSFSSTLSTLTSGTPISGVTATTSTSTQVACPDLFATYMKKGNRGAEVKKLQEFLNTQLGTKIPVTGYFGTMTFAAVKQFQTKHAATTLKPWKTNTGAATGYFFKTTQRQANILLCPTLDIPMPTLE